MPAEFAQPLNFASTARAAGQTRADVLRLRLINPARLDAADQARWDDLGRHKSGDNVFAEPWLMQISLAHCDAGQAAMLGVVEDDAGQWIGALPVLRSLRHGRLPWPNWSGWRHANQFNGTALVRGGKEVPFWRGLLAGLDRQPGLANMLCLHDLPTDDPVNQALMRVCQEGRRPWKAYRHFARACLHADSGLKARAEAVGKPKHRRRLDSLERQLAEEHGEIRFQSTRDPESIKALIPQFLLLEAAGWKGAAGSALDFAADTRGFFTQAAEAAAARHCFEVSWLEAGGQCLAMTTQFVLPDWSCGFKRAHDERFARFAPGQIHLRHLTRRLCSEAASNFDSSASPGQVSINHLWPDQRELFDCRIAVGGAGHRMAFHLLQALQSAYHAVKRICALRR